jgi:predicted nucleic acid-binding protein
VSDYLADSTVVIDNLRGRKHVMELLHRLNDAGHQLCCCDVTICEVYLGMRREEREGTERFVGGLLYLPTSREIAERAGLWCYEYRRRGVTIDFGDALIAATAEAHGAILLTANTRHFPFEGLVVEEVRSVANDTPSTPEDGGDM